MPSWPIHLKIAKEVNKKLNLDNDLFYYGNLIPDVDNNTKISRFTSHYYGNLKFPNCNESMIDVEAFIKDYKDKMNNPLIIGYYCHLLTDNYYNDYICTNCLVINENKDAIGIKLNNGTIIDVDVEDKQRLKRKYKHDDLELYGKYLLNNEELYIPKNSNKIIMNINMLKDNFLTEENVTERINFLNNDFYKNNKLDKKTLEYKLFTKNELDTLIDSCAKFILAEIDNL